jgi:hypothetical protein
MTPVEELSAIRAYVAPDLVVYGDIAELTHGAKGKSKAKAKKASKHKKKHKGKGGKHSPRS